MIQVGDKIPASSLWEMEASGVVKLDSAAVFAQGKIVAFAVPGAFTPTCSKAHLPGFVARADDFRARGVDQVICLSVNDAFVMDAWGREHNAGGQVRMLADGNGELATALGLEVDARELGRGLRCRRFAMLVEDGVVRDLAVEAPGQFDVSSAEAMLARC